MKKNSFISEWDGSLNQIKKALEAKSVDYAFKANVAIDLLEVSLSTLVDLGLLSKVAVEVDGHSDNGKHIIRKYALGKKEVEDEDGYFEEVPCLKQSRLECDE